MYYGIDIGGSKIALAVFDEQGAEQQRHVCPTPQTSYAAITRVIVSWVKEMDQRWHTQGRVGIGFPGILDAIGCVSAANVPSIHGQHLVNDLQLALARPVAADNDAHCFLLSEYQGGAAAQAKLALALTLGTGVGGAVIHQGQLLNSQRGGSGEFGHAGIQARVWSRHPDLPLFKCGCGQAGCVETYVSGTGLSNLYHYFANTTVANSITGPAIIRAWQQGETIATQSVSLYLDILASVLASLMTQFDPDVVVLGGGLAEHAWLYEELTPRISNYLMADFTSAPIVKPHFGGSGGVRGAALLAKCAV